MKSEINNLNIQTNLDTNQINWFNSTSKLNSRNSSPYSTLENSFGTFTHPRDSDFEQFRSRKIHLANTKLIASISKNFSKESITKLLKEGIRIFRINGQLFNHKEYSKIIKEINSIFEIEKLDEKPTIIFDLKGPIPMITRLNNKREDGIFHVRKGQVIKLTYDTGNKKVEEDNLICLDKKIVHALKQGDLIHINNTRVVLKVIGFDRYKKTKKFRRNSTADRERLNFRKNRDIIYKNIMESMNNNENIEKKDNRNELPTYGRKNGIGKKLSQSKSDSNLRDCLKKFSEGEKERIMEIDLLMEKFNSKFEEIQIDGDYYCDGNSYESCEQRNECDYDCGKRKLSKAIKMKRKEEKLDPFETFSNCLNYCSNFNKLEKAYRSIIEKNKITKERNENPFEHKNCYEKKEKVKFFSSIINNFNPEEDDNYDKCKNSNDHHDQYSFPYNFLVNDEFKINLFNPSHEFIRENLKYNNNQKESGNCTNPSNLNEFECFSRQFRNYNSTNSQKFDEFDTLDSQVPNPILSKRQRIKSMNSNLHKFENYCNVKKNNLIVCEVESEGSITEYQKLTVIERDIISSMDTPVIGAKEVIDISKSAELGINFLSCLVNNASNINDIRDLLSEESKKTMGILARIETTEAVYNFNEILEKVDGVIIFHGIFTNKISVSDLIFIESYMIEKCKFHDKIVLFQTENIFENNRKFISELSTIDSMIKEGLDGIILKEEINVNLRNNLNTIKSIKEIIIQCESEMEIKINKLNDDDYHSGFHSTYKHHSYFRKYCVDSELNGLDYIFHSAVQASHGIDADIIILYSDEPKILKRLSKLHPKCLIIYPTSEIQVSAYVSLIRGVIPFVINKNIETDHGQEYITQMILEIAKERNMLNSDPEKKVIVLTAYLNEMKKKSNGMLFFVKTL